MAKTRRKERAPRAHTRVIDTLTGPSERRVLRWLAAHLPAWVTPDHLTALSFFGAVVIAASYILSRQNPILLWLAIAGFILNWFGDSLDGTLARYRHIERPRYGFFIDHSVDALSEILIFFSIGLTIYVRFEIASVALVGYLALSLYTALSTYAASEFKISYAYLGPTEIRLIAMLATAWVYFNPTRFVNLLGGKFSFFELVTLGLIILFYSAFILSTAGQAIRLAQADKPHLPKKITKPASRPTFFGGLQASLSKRLHSGRKIL